MKLRTTFILTFLLLLTATSIYSQSNTQKIDTLMIAYHDLGQFNGTVLIAENSKVIYKKGFAALMV